MSYFRAFPRAASRAQVVVAGYVAVSSISRMTNHAPKHGGLTSPMSGSSAHQWYGVLRRDLSAPAPRWERPAASLDWH